MTLSSHVAISACVDGMPVSYSSTRIQKVREAANRASTNNNLRQLGVAVHSDNDGFTLIDLLVVIATIGQIFAVFSTIWCASF